MMKYDELSKRQKTYVDGIIEHGPTLGLDIEKQDFSRAELRQVSMTMKGKKWIPNWITHDQSRRVDRGVFSIPEIQDALSVAPGQETEGDIEQDSVETIVDSILPDNTPDLVGVGAVETETL